MRIPPEGTRLRSSKTYVHSVGLPTCFRQWKAESHCRFLHGYSLEIRIEFEADEVDIRDWVVDFGSLKTFKGWLEDTFDHKTLVAEDDPQKWKLFNDMNDQGLIDMVIVPATGCEAFASMIYEAAEIWLGDAGYKPRVWVALVEVREHAGNSAIVEHVRPRRGRRKR